MWYAKYLSIYGLVNGGLALIMLLAAIQNDRITLQTMVMIFWPTLIGSTVYLIKVLKAGQKPNTKSAPIQN